MFIKPEKLSPHEKIYCFSCVNFIKRSDALFFYEFPRTVNSIASNLSSYFIEVRNLHPINMHDSLSLN